jgi:hypothetical protein
MAEQHRKEVLYHAWAEHVQEVPDHVLAGFQMSELSYRIYCSAPGCAWRYGVRGLRAREVAVMIFALSLPAWFLPETVSGWPWLLCCVANWVAALMLTLLAENRLETCGHLVEQMWLPSWGAIGSWFLRNLYLFHLGAALFMCASMAFFSAMGWLCSGWNSPIGQHLFVFVNIVGIGINSIIAVRAKGRYDRPG